ncbi:MAG: hypothetical protein EKK55_14715 [Rhodocyclaceae bacterium]|nr:MAG: hypothetical protein EKK55_14715 [Rhodocyclaceae bacterium]
MTPRPYVGISGVMSAAEADTLLLHLPPVPARKLMVGVLTTSGILTGNGITNPRRYPPPGRIAGIFRRDPHGRVVNLVHVAWKQQERYGSCAQQLIRAREAGGLECHGIQINGVQLPTPGDIEVYARAFPDDRIVLQYRNLALDTSEILMDVRRYAWTVTDVLLDGSAGEGKAYTVAGLHKVAHACAALREHFPFLGVGFAGGLSAEAVPAIEPMLRAIPRLSVDAEGKLRDEHDQLDLPAAVRFESSVLTVVGDGA